MIAWTRAANGHAQGQGPLDILERMAELDRAFRERRQEREVSSTYAVGTSDRMNPMPKGIDPLGMDAAYHYRTEHNYFLMVERARAAVRNHPLTAALDQRFGPAFKRPARGQHLRCAEVLAGADSRRVAGSLEENILVCRDGPRIDLSLSHLESCHCPQPVWPRRNLENLVGIRVRFGLGWLKRISRKSSTDARQRGGARHYTFAHTPPAGEPCGGGQAVR
jgi:hypothetical protein